MQNHMQNRENRTIGLRKWGRYLLTVLPVLIATTAVFAVTQDDQNSISTQLPLQDDQNSISTQLPLSTPPPFEARHIVWPMQGEISTELRSRLTDSMLLRIARSPLPVLLPDVEEVRNGHLLTNSYNYSFSLVVPQRYSMVIYAFGFRRPETIGTEEAKKTRGHGPGYLVRGQAGEISESEGIWRVEWEEFGARYQLKFSCGVQIADDECPVALSELLDVLTFVGGSYIGQS